MGQQNIPQRPSREIDIYMPANMDTLTVIYRMRAQCVDLLSHCHTCIYTCLLSPLYCIDSSI